MDQTLSTLRADNPGPFTGLGTNTYVLGQGAKTIVDPGPDMPAHLAAILGEVGRDRVEAILVTHAHSDHSALAPRLARLTGAPILAFGDARAGMTAQMQAREAEGIDGGEGRDAGFAPDVVVQDVSVANVAAPGAAGNPPLILLESLDDNGDVILARNAWSPLWENNWDDAGVESGQILPSGPAANARGPESAAGIVNSVITPAGVMRPILPPANSPNQILPSLPSAIARGWLFGVGISHSVILPFGVIRAMRLPPCSENHRLPSLPSAMMRGELSACGSRNS